MCCPLQESLFGQSAVSTDVASAKGEEDKDAHHGELVQAGGGVSFPLVDCGQLLVILSSRTLLLEQLPRVASLTVLPFVICWSNSVFSLVPQCLNVVQFVAYSPL